MQLPLPVRGVFQSGKGILFLGAGVGFNAINSRNEHMPTARGLAARMATHFQIDPEGDLSLSKISQIVEGRRGRPELLAYLAEHLSGFEPDTSLRWLVCRTWRAIFTTNYDNLIERSFELASESLQRPVSISLNSNFAVVDPRFEVPIYHLHGSLFEGSPPNILITENDYAKFREHRRMLFEVLKQEMTSSVIVYAGYSHDDPNWKMVLQELLAEFAPTPLPPSFRIAPSTPSIDKEILERNSVTTIDGTTDDLVQAASAELGDIHVDPKNLDDLRDAVPSDLRAAFDLNVAQMTRLLASWEYVNQADFSTAGNAYDFLRGNKPNWACIGSWKHFRRDIEQPVSDALLDYVTANQGGRKALLVLGPAGYGTTTVLMSIAADLVKQQVGPIFMHKPGAQILEGDIEFATTLLLGRAIFVVDDAAGKARSLKRVLERLKNLRRDACFLLGDRPNQWRQLPLKVVAVEFPLEPLSEAEIVRLLDCLSRNNELGKLEQLSHDLQMAAVKGKHDSQLLVALRELTEGLGFDAIIEDEFRGIPGDVARKLYAVVACAYKLRLFVREAVMVEVLGLADIPSMHRAIDHSLDGVVDTECIDEANGLYAFRCRHHAVAEIVWTRCVQPEDRQDILLKMIRHLNLLHFLDVRLFDELIQSDDEIDRLGTLEIKTAFFELACKKAPDNAYVRQHYARMLLREGRHELALQEINAALAITKARIFFHTRGMIYKDMALTGSADGVARRRLVQSESDFREAIRLDSHDAYSYQSLAELFFRWAQQCENDEEEADYIRRAESVVSEGMTSVRHRDGLWIVSAKIYEWLGNQPRAVANLEKASDSDIAQFLLAKIYIDQDKVEKAAGMLHSLLVKDPRNVRCALLYAQCLLLMGKPLKEAIAALWLANFGGLRDGRYVVTLSGLLFLDRQFTEAKRILETAERSTAEEKLRAVYRHPTPEVFTGTVSTVKGGYAFIALPGYPEIFCPTTKVGSLVLSRGTRVTFTLKFSWRGPAAENISAVVGS